MQQEGCPVGARGHGITFAPTPGSERGQQGVLIPGFSMRPYDPPEETNQPESSQLEEGGLVLPFSD